MQTGTSCKTTKLTFKREKLAMSGLQKYALKPRSIYIRFEIRFNFKSKEESEN